MRGQNALSPCRTWQPAFRQGAAATLLLSGLALSTLPARPAYAAIAPPQAAENSPAATAAASQAAVVRQLVESSAMWRNKYRDDLALQMVQKALLISPDNLDALAELGQIEIRSNQMDDASHLLFRLRTLYPNAAQTRELGYAYMAASTGKQELAEIGLMSRRVNSAQAIVRLQALFSEGPPTGDLAGTYYTILGEDLPHRPQAIAALKRIVADDPNNFNAAFALVSLLVRDSSTLLEGLKLAQQVAANPDVDRSAALDTWRRALRYTSPDPKFIDAQQAYVDAAPDDTEFKALLAASRDALAARLKLEADPGWQAEQQGLQLLYKGDSTQAEPLLMKALATRNSDPELLGGLGLLRMRQGRHIEARAFFLEAARLDAPGRAGWESLANTSLFWGTLSQGREAIAQGHPERAEQAAHAALAMQANSPEALSLLADALVAQHRWSEAEPLLHRQLEIPGQTLDALRTLTGMLRDTGRASEIAPLMAAMQPRFTGADLASFNGLRADQLSDQADVFLAQSKIGPAIEVLEQSIHLAPSNAWTRFKLARTYRDQGLPQLGRSVMAEGLAGSTSPEMRYASALYLNSIDDVTGAIAALTPVPEDQRTDGMRSLAHNLQAQALLAQAQRQFAAGQRQASENSLDAAAQLVPDDPDMLASLARQWITEGQADRGLALMQTWLDGHTDQPVIDARLRFGDLLASADRETSLTQWLEQLQQRQDLTPEQRTRLEDQSLRQALRLTDAAQAAADYRKADAILAAVSPTGRADPRWALELADLRRVEDRIPEARAAVTKVLEKYPDNLDAKLTLARIDEQSGQTRQALDLIRQVLQAAPTDDVATRLSAARRLLALQQPAAAASVVDQLQTQFPTNPDITLQRGRILQAQGQYEAARAVYLDAQTQEPAANTVAGPFGTPAQVAVFDLDQRRQPLIETAIYPAYKSGTSGVSALREEEVPLYVQLPQGYLGHWFFHADTVHLDAGLLNPADAGASFSDASGTGTFAAYKSSTTFSPTPGAANVTLLGPLQQQATGVAVGVGFETDNWRADLGTTPIGFPVQNVVGGIKFSIPNDIGSLSINLSRRPETSSMLSYAGAHDPVTNQVYGGVVRSGIDLYASKDIGKVNVFAALGAGVLTGRNVETNQAETLRTGVDIPIFTALNWHLDSGLVGNYWHYAQNLRFYTFGQGGYYSPQRYLSLGVPLDWVARYGRASWELDTSVGWSHSFEASSPFFPTDPVLQASALANSVNNTNSASSGTGISYSVSAIFQYVMSAHLTGGFRLSIDRSRDYAPSTAMAYLRYTFNPGHDGVAFPTVVTPYSDY